MGRIITRRKEKNEEVYYVPTSNLSKPRQTKRIQKVREQVKRFRKQKKGKTLQEEKAQNSFEAAEQLNLRSSCSVNRKQFPLIVDFNFQKGKNMAKKRINRQVASAKRTINKLAEENKRLKKTTAKLYKRVSRQEGSTASDATQENEHSPSSVSPFSSPATLTPKRRTDQEIKSYGISSSTCPKPLRRKLLASNILSDEIKQSSQAENKRKRHLIRNVVSGKIAKKYCVTRMITGMTSLDRKKLASTKSKCLASPSKKRSTNILVTVSSKVETLLSKEDSSRIMPGKKGRLRFDPKQGTQ